MDFFSKLLPSLKCYRNPEQCPHFKQKMKKEREGRGEHVDRLKESEGAKLSPENQKDIEEIKTQIALNSIHSDFKLYNKKDFDLFYKRMKSYPTGSPELEACAIRLKNSHKFWSPGATHYFIKHQFSIAQLRYLHSFGVIYPQIFFEKKQNHKPLFTKTICQNPQLFIQMVTNNEIRLDEAPTDQLFTCLGHLKGHDQAVGLLAQKIYKSNINKI